MRAAARNSSSATGYQNECSAATPRRKWACASCDFAEVGNLHGAQARFLGVCLGCRHGDRDDAEREQQRPSRQASKRNHGWALHRGRRRPIIDRRTPGFVRPIGDFRHCLDHAETMNRQVLDLDGAEPGPANGQAANREPSDRHRAEGESADRRGAESQRGHPGRGQSRTIGCSMPCHPRAPAWPCTSLTRASRGCSPEPGHGPGSCSDAGQCSLP